MMLLVICFLFFILTRIYPYFFTSVPLGYDPGLYLYLFKQYSHVPFLFFASFPQILAGDFPPGTAVLGKIMTNFLLPESLLLPLMIFFEVLLLLSLYLFTKKLWNKRVALWTIFIYACSAIQFRHYWYYYLSNIAALSFLFLTFSFLVSHSYWAAIFAILTIYFHRPTAALLLAALFFSLIVQKKHRKYYGLIFAISFISGAIYYIPTFEKTILPLIQPFFASFVPQRFGGSMGMPSGTFYTLPQSLFLSLPYFSFGVYGFLSIWKKEKFNLVTIPTLLIIPILFLRIYFFRRFIPFLDLFLIFFAGYGAAHFFKGKRVAKYVYITAMVIFIAFFIHKTGHPLIEEDELREIKMLKQTEKDSYILTTDEWYTPWVYGWSDRKPIAPGFGEYDIYWTIPEWHQFWESGSRETEKNLLLKLPKPLYIYKGDLGSPIKADFSGDCFERINWRTYKFVCEGGPAPP